MNEIEHSVNIFVASMDDLAPILRRFGAYKRGNVKAIFKAQGPGWQPLSKSTVERLSSTGTDKVTARGKLRESYVKSREVQLKKLSKSKKISSIQAFFDSKLATKREKGYAASRELEELRRLHDNASSAPSGEFKSLSTASKRISKIKSGKKVSGHKALEKHSLLGKLANSITTRIYDGKVIVESRAPWSEAHNAGETVGHGSKLPPRTFLEVTAQDMEMFAEIAQDYLLEKFGIKKKK